MRKRITPCNILLPFIITLQIMFVNSFYAKNKGKFYIIMKTRDFFYDLPEELIAQTPLEPRNMSRLMVLSKDDGSISHNHFYDLPKFLKHSQGVMFMIKSICKALCRLTEFFHIYGGFKRCTKYYSYATAIYVGHPWLSFY